MDLNDKRAIVLGGTSGIGLAVTRQLIEAGLPGARAQVNGDDGVHFEALVVSEAFRGKLPLARHRMAVDAGHHRCRFARHVDQDGGDGAAIHRAVIDRREHDDRARGVHAGRDRDEQRGAGGGADARQQLQDAEAGDAVATVSAQLDASLPHGDGASAGVPARFAIAYEPIWAIGTGKVPSTNDIAEMHAALRRRLVAAYGDAGLEVRILYGGSVKASNAAEIFGVADVDGALVGGASLQSGDFLPIVEAAARTS